jgi:hypothetical protein
VELLGDGCQGCRLLRVGVSGPSVNSRVGDHGGDRRPGRPGLTLGSSSSARTNTVSCASVRRDGVSGAAHRQWFMSLGHPCSGAGGKTYT